MDIERLKELQKVVEEKSCRAVIEDDGEESVYEIEDKELMWALEECSTLIDEAIARQSETEKVVCPDCGGSGVYQEYDEYDRYYVHHCPTCDGSGEVYRQPESEG